MNLVTNLTQPARQPGDPRVLETGHSSLTTSYRAARALGWFSMGLGLVELFAAGPLSQKLGMKGKQGLIQAYGAREIGAGVLSLSVNKQAGLSSRLLGDAVDAVTLLSVLPRANRRRGNVLLALAFVGGVAVLDAVVLAAVRRSETRKSQPRDYGDRSGFPRGIQAARGAVRGRFESFNQTDPIDHQPSGRGSAAAGA